MDDADRQSPPTSPTLIASVIAGEEKAWGRFVRVYGPLVFLWCHRSGLQRADAEDVAQDVMMAVNRSLDQFQHRDHDGSFRAWLWAVCRHKILDFRRRKPVADQAVGGTRALRTLVDLPEKSPQTQQDISDLHLRLLEELKLGFSETVWTAFWRCTIEGDAAKDVANDLGTTVWAVYKAKARVLTRLREEWGEELGMAGEDEMSNGDR